MSDDRDLLRFGVAITPTVDLAEVRALALAADGAGVDLVGLQDHPYAATHLEAFVVAADLLARTERVTVFPDVANLPLRPPAMLARSAAALNRASDGRFALGLGAGGYWDAIAAMGAQRHTRGQARAALEEAIAILRALWQPDQTVSYRGEHYRVAGVQGADPGPGGVPIWIGAQGPRSFELTGRLADGWAAPIASYLPYEQWATANAAIDDAARAAGRNPRAVERIAQVVGAIEPGPGPAGAPLAVGDAPLITDADGWAHALADLAISQPFRTFVFWPMNETVEQIERFAHDVAPSVRTLVNGGDRRLS